MKRKQGPILTAVLVDYDNIYLALRRKNEDAAKRFAKDAGHWLKQIETGQLITPTNSAFSPPQRRIVLNRCYGNPVPRRNTHDNSTDMYSFPFVRHHFLRSGFEVVDCPPLTAQLKNSSDIRMVMDVRDYLLHETYFDEFIILSGDADFAPVLHRLRAHARRTAIFANDHTAAPYKAISDGEVREIDLIELLTEAKASIEADAPAASVAAVQAPMLTQQPYHVPQPGQLPAYDAPPAPAALAMRTEPPMSPPIPQQQTAYRELPPQPVAPVHRGNPEVASATALQQSIARIHDACQAPPLSPPEYRILFEAMAREIAENRLAGSQTLTNIVQRAQEQGVEVRRDDVRFVLEVVSESDPWFEQGASPTLFAGRFRNFVVARCRSQGLNLSVDELDLIEAWFVAGAPAMVAAPQAQQAPAPAAAEEDLTRIRSRLRSIAALF